MSEIITEGVGNLPNEPVFIVPNRVDLQVIHALEDALGGPNRVAWYVEQSHKPSDEILAYLNTSRAAGGAFNMERMSPEEAAAFIGRARRNHLHAVYLPGGSGAGSELSEVSGRLLGWLESLNIPVVPVFAGMYNRDLPKAVVTSAPYDQLRVQFLPMQRVGAGQASRIRSLWQEASADHLAVHPLLEVADLPRALLDLLMHNRDGVLIDGVDDSRLDYGNLLMASVLMAKQLRKKYLLPRMGILLPPGKYATCANLACIFAGITPVNFSWEASAASFEQAVRISRVSRFITEDRFVEKMQDFAWPQERDLIYLNRELARLSGGEMKIWRLMTQFAGADFASARAHLATPSPDSEAMIFFSHPETDAPQGTVLTHRMLLAALVQTGMRLRPSAGERILCAMPLCHSCAAVINLLMPLIYGLDMVTYPSQDVPRRLAHLALRYKVAHAVLEPWTLQEILEQGGGASFAACRHLIMAGGLPTAQLLTTCREQLPHPPELAFTRVESGAPISLGVPALVADGISCGTPLYGAAIRISDINRAGRIIPMSDPGALWVSGVSLAPAYLGASAAENPTIRGKWLRTGDVARVDETGRLVISGRAQRFSHIDDRLVSHELVEEIIATELKLEPSAERQIAVVEVPDRASGSVRLVMLSTIHQAPHPNDYVTIRYALTNARYPSAWAPYHILPMRRIPVLPSGELDYRLSRSIACQLLRIHE